MAASPRNRSCVSGSRLLGCTGCCRNDTLRSPDSLAMQFPVGRRVLVAVLTGPAGDQVQAWREKYDARQAQRLPPHLTICYRPPLEPLEALAAQVRRGFPAPVAVRLGPVFVLAHREAPLAVSILDTAALDDARR